MAGFQGKICIVKTSKSIRAWSFGWNSEVAGIQRPWNSEVPLYTYNIGLLCGCEHGVRPPLDWFSHSMIVATEKIPLNNFHSATSCHQEMNCILQ